MVKLKLGLTAQNISTSVVLVGNEKNRRGEDIQSPILLSTRCILTSMQSAYLLPLHLLQGLNGVVFLKHSYWQWPHGLCSTEHTSA